MKRRITKIISAVLVLVIFASLSTSFAANDCIILSRVVLEGIAVQKNAAEGNGLPDAEYGAHKQDFNTKLVFNKNQIDDDEVRLEGYVIDDVNIPIQIVGYIKKWDNYALFIDSTDKKGNWEILNFAVYFDSSKAIIFNESLLEQEAPILAVCFRNIANGKYYIFEEILEKCSLLDSFIKQTGIFEGVSDFENASPSQILWIAAHIKDKSFSSQEISSNEYGLKRSRQTHDLVTVRNAFVNSYTFNGHSWVEQMIVVHTVMAPVNLSTSQLAKAFLSVESTRTTRDGYLYSNSCPTIEIGHGALTSDPGTKIEALLQNSDHEFNSMVTDGEGTMPSNVSVVLGISYTVPYTIISFDLTYSNTVQKDLNENYGSFTNYAPSHYHRSAEAIFPNNFILQATDDFYSVDYTIIDLTTATSTGCYLSCKFSYYVYDAYLYDELCYYTRIVSNYYAE
ncbi:MAG: hypothetical protein IKX20_00395 [Paludibacteraceae bacterium]|nr:hypothetical protein [Paludibacteraceae bacterium]